jgi:hypothetical protein
LFLVVWIEILSRRDKFEVVDLSGL